MVMNGGWCIAISTLDSHGPLRVVFHRRAWRTGWISNDKPRRSFPNRRDTQPGRSHHSIADHSIVQRFFWNTNGQWIFWRIYIYIYIYIYIDHTYYHVYIIVYTYTYIYYIYIFIFIFTPNIYIYAYVKSGCLSSKPTLSAGAKAAPKPQQRGTSFGASEDLRRVLELQRWGNHGYISEYICTYIYR